MLGINQIIHNYLKNSNGATTDCQMSISQMTNDVWPSKSELFSLSQCQQWGWTQALHLMMARQLFYRCAATTRQNYKLTFFFAIFREY